MECYWRASCTSAGWVSFPVLFVHVCVSVSNFHAYLYACCNVLYIYRDSYFCSKVSQYQLLRHQLPPRPHHHDVPCLLSFIYFQRWNTQAPYITRDPPTFGRAVAVTTTASQSSIRQHTHTHTHAYINTQTYTWVYSRINLSSTF